MQNVTISACKKTDVVIDNKKIKSIRILKERLEGFETLRKLM